MMPHAKAAKDANWIFDVGFFPAVAGHADAWILDLSRAACKTSKGFVQRCENNQMHPSLPPFAALADLADLA
jgi:hypothetical protein